MEDRGGQRCHMRFSSYPFFFLGNASAVMIERQLLFTPGWSDSMYT